MSEKIGKIRLIAGIIALLLLIAAIAGFNYFTFSKTETAILEQLNDKQLIAAEYAARQIESHIYRTRDELTTLSKFPVMKTLDISQCSGDMKIVHQSLESKINSLLRVNRAGKILESSTPLYSSFVGVNIADKDYFKTPMKTKEAFISGLIRQGSSGHIIVSAPMFESASYTPYPNFKEEFNGTLLTIIEIGSLYDLYIHPLLESARGEFILFKEDTGETILRSESAVSYETAKSLVTRHGPGSYGEIVSIDGVKSLFAMVHFKMGEESWGLVVITPVSRVGSELGMVQLRNLISLLIIIAAITGLAVFAFSLFRSKQEMQTRLKKASNLLERFGITVGVEGGKYSNADISLEPGKIYLIKEENDAQAFELFVSALNKGFAGLGIVREHPEKVREKYNLKKTSFIWLTEPKDTEVPSANDIATLSGIISEFIEKGRKSVILIDRLDYLVRVNKFEDFMKWLYGLKDAIQSREIIVIISANPSLMQDDKLRAVEAETEDVYKFKGKAGLSDTELKILQFVNDRNKSSRLASFIDITSNFNITKPTTRVKINKLVGMGLLVIEKHGRYKAIKITSAGRRLI